MRIFVYLSILLSAMSAEACLRVTGTYICDVYFEGDINPVSMTFETSTDADEVYALKVAQENQMFSSEFIFDGQRHRTSTYRSSRNAFYSASCTDRTFRIQQEDTNPDGSYSLFSEIVISKSGFNSIQMETTGEEIKYGTETTFPKEITHCDQDPLNAPRVSGSGNRLRLNL